MQAPRWLTTTRRAAPRPEHLFLHLMTGLVLAFMLVPIAIIVLASFTDSVTMEFPPKGLSLRWYGSLWKHLSNAPGVTRGLGLALTNSVELALISSIISLAVGVPAAYALYRRNVRFREALRMLFYLPLIFPQVVTGIGLLLVFSETRLFTSFTRLVIGHVILTIPYVILTLGASLELYEQELEEAAFGLGANFLQVFTYITLPLIRVGIASSIIFSAITSFTQFTVSYFLFTGESTTVPMWMISYVTHVMDPLIAALSTLLILLTLVVMGIGYWAFGRRLIKR